MVREILRGILIVKTVGWCALRGRNVEVPAVFWQQETSLVGLVVTRQ